MNEITSLADGADQQRFDRGLPTMTLRMRWLAGQWTGLVEKYAALGRAYPDRRGRPT